MPQAPAQGLHVALCLSQPLTFVVGAGTWPPAHHSCRSPCSSTPWPPPCSIFPLAKTPSPWQGSTPPRCRQEFHFDGIICSNVDWRGGGNTSYIYRLFLPSNVNMGNCLLAYREKLSSRVFESLAPCLGVNYMSQKCEYRCERHLRCHRQDPHTCRGRIPAIEF